MRDAQREQSPARRSRPGAQRSRPGARRSRPGSRRGDGLLVVSALCAAATTVVMVQVAIERDDATWWIFVGCGAVSTACAALARRTPAAVSVALALLVALPLAYLTMIFVLVPTGWLAAAGAASALAAAVAHGRRG